MLLAIGVYWALEGRRFADERWPEGQTIDIRTRVEQVIPPPPGTRFVDVVRYGGAGDTPYGECIYYQSEMGRSDIIAYYASLIERRGWHTASYPESLYATDRSDVMTATTDVGVYSWPIGSNAEHSPYTYAVCSDSLTRAADSMSEGKQ